LFELALKNVPACLDPASGRRVIPDEATFLARLNFRNEPSAQELSATNGREQTNEQR